MRKMLFAILGLAFLMSCEHKDENSEHKEENSIQKWEYKVLKFDYSDFFTKREDEEYAAFYAMTRDMLMPLEDTLSVLGKDGWELISTYTTISTSFPNFGNDQYITGIREQTATRVLTAILKRPYIETNEKGKMKKK